MLLGTEQLARRLATRTLFEGVSFQLRAGECLGLVGPNGAGKSSLLRILSGEDAPDDGRLLVPRGSHVARLRQEIDPAGERCVREEAATALAHLDELERELRELEHAMAHAGRDGEDVSEDLAERYDLARQRFEHGGGFEREAQVEAVLAGLGFDAEARERPLREFSGGWLMRVELAKLLLAEPDVLLLDEPTNHLDLPSIQWLEERLGEFRGAVVIVSHDRHFLRRHSDRIAELDGHGGFHLYEGGFDRYLTQKAADAEQLEARRRQQEREVERVERFVQRFRAKASKAKQVQSRVKQLEKLERVAASAPRRKRMRLHIPEPARAGEVVMTLAGIHKRYGEVEVYRGADLELRRGDRLALVGPNGAGKTTLLRILAGALPFDSGERRPGHNVRVAFYAQHQLENLSPERSVLEELASIATSDDYPRLRDHLGAFLFTREDVEKKVAVLSGGEKARLALAKLLLRPANLLVLDEPTNHLDIESCEVLEDALRQYQGTLALISHDRDFLNALATRVVEVRAGTLREYVGNYDDYWRRASSSGDALPTGDTQAAAAASGEPARSKADRARERERRKALERVERRLGRLEEEILEREKRVEELGWRLGDPEIYRDPDQLRELEEARGALRGEIEARYAEWERLAEEQAGLAEAS